MKTNEQIKKDLAKNGIHVCDEFLQSLENLENQIKKDKEENQMLGEGCSFTFKKKK